MSKAARHCMTPEQTSSLLRTMEISRQGDRREGILLRQSKGWFHVAGMGHEAIAALAYCVRPDDLLYPYYRDRSLVLARGVSNLDLALAFYAREASSSGGRQMPGHYSDHRLGVFSVATPTGSQCLPAAGAAWGCRLDNSDRVVLCSVGDAALRQGEYYEAVAFAVQENLPLIIVVEDNGYGISTPTDRHNPHRMAILAPDIVVKVNGRIPNDVYSAGVDAVARARSGGGPTILWCDLDRLSPHTSSDDHRVYRGQDDIAAMEARDPIPMLLLQMIRDGVLTQSEWDGVREEIALSVELDYARAETSPVASLDAIAVDVCAEPSDTTGLPVVLSGEATMVSAINDTLRAALRADPRVIMFGEDIADPKGGVFGMTKGLSTDYPGRVVNSPLAEATIVGAGVGLGASGWRPVFEIQFIDFVGPGLNQLLNQAATLRWRTCGDFTCPMTILAPAGAYLPGGGMWHSQTNEGWWAHVPGLNVCVPSNPEDAAGLLWSAIQSDDPTLVLIPKHVFRRRVQVSGAKPVPLGSLAVRRSGSDVTLVAWGNCVELAEEAADQLLDEGISVEVLDLRSIAPCDWAGIQASVGRTGRLVVIHEDSRTGGFGDTIVAEMTSRAERWDLFLSAPQIVAREDVPVPFCPVLEYGVLPDVGDVVAAARSVVA